MGRLTHAEMTAFKMLNEAIEAAPKQHLVNWLVSLTADELTPDQLEQLSNETGRAGHYKNRNHQHNLERLD